MQPGQILIDTQFEVFDKRGIKHVIDKYLVVLAQRTTSQYLMVQTTTKNSRYSNSSGCNIDHFLNFHIIRGTEQACFPDDTWIQLDEFHLVEVSDVLEKGIDNIIKLKGVLSKPTLKSLLSCACHSNDINPFDEDILNQIIQSLS